MEENKKNDFEDFNDFDEVDTEKQLKDMLEEEASIFQNPDKKEAEEASEVEENKDETKQEETDNQIEEKEEIKEETKEEIKEEIKEVTEQIKEIAPRKDLSLWEEFDKNDSVIKKYIFYASKDFVPLLDSMDTDKRSAYINDSIQKKLDFEDIEKQNNNKKRALKHILIMVLITIFATPFILFAVHKAIMMTFDNYKYSQENFEKLYRQRFKQDKAYMRSIQYNQRHNLNNKNNEEENK